MEQEFFVSSFSSTRAGNAIKAGAVVKRIQGIPIVSIESPRTFANGKCCDFPYSIEYVCSSGSSVHVWFTSIPDTALLDRVVRVLLYWNDLIVLTWSLGEPQGYRTYFKLEEKENSLQKESTELESEIA